jgi:hypothetical protein
MVIRKRSKAPPNGDGLPFRKRARGKIVEFLERMGYVVSPMPEGAQGDSLEGEWGTDLLAFHPVFHHHLLVRCKSTSNTSANAVGFNCDMDRKLLALQSPIGLVAVYCERPDGGYHFKGFPPGELRDRVISCKKGQIWIPRSLTRAAGEDENSLDVVLRRLLAQHRAGGREPNAEDDQP